MNYRSIYICGTKELYNNVIAAKAANSYKETYCVTDMNI